MNEEADKNIVQSPSEIITSLFCHQNIKGKCITLTNPQNIEGKCITLKNPQNI